MIKFEKALLNMILQEKYIAEEGDTPKLTSEQKKVLKEYISNISNTNDFNAFVKNQLPILENRLNKKIKKVKDKILKIKLHEAVNCIGKFCLTEGKVTEDKSIVQLLRYYELDKELNKI